MTYSYDRRGARIPSSLGVRSGYELRVIGFLSDVWPFQVQYGKGNDEVDMLEVAARGVDTMKRKHPDLWEGMVEVNLHPKDVADIIVSVALKESRSFKGSAAGRYTTRTAKAKHPDVVKSLVDYLKTGPFKPHLKVKSAQANKVVLIPQGLNDQVERVEISGLQGDKAEFVVFLTNGDSGWAWNEWRQPPKFHNDAGYNVIHLDKLDRIANPQTDPAKFEQHMMSLCKGTLIPAIQKAGWVIDPATKRPVKLDQWQVKQETPKPEAGEPTADLFRDLVTKAIKKVGDGVRAIGLGSIVKFNPQERIDDDSRGIHSTFFLKMEHERITWHHRPGINFYWDKSKNEGSVSTSNLVNQGKRYENLPLTKMGTAMLEAADDILNDLKKQLNQRGSSTEVWSVVTLGKSHGYAVDVQVFNSKSKAEAEARNQGDCYVVNGTQMWNEPLGQVEEHDREAPYKYFARR